MSVECAASDMRSRRCRTVTATMTEAAEALPSRIRDEAAACAGEARAIAWLTLDLIKRVEALQTCTDLLVSRDEYFNSGDFLCAVEEEIGVSTAAEVLAGLAVAVADLIGGTAGHERLEMARQHASITTGRSANRTSSRLTTTSRRGGPGFGRGPLRVS